MFFCGDIAIPYGVSFNIETSVKLKGCGIGNLEGLINLDKTALNTYKVCNYVDVIDVMKRLGIKAVCLANNHVNDFGGEYENTIKLLNENNIKYFGAGRSRTEAARPVIIDEDNHQYALLGFGWDVIGCRKKDKNSVVINQLSFHNVKHCIENVRSKYPKARIIPVFHWDYELEILPMPAHRLLAHRCIEWGAYCVIGHHPHLVQQVESYDDKMIIYSLGNFLFPDGKYFRGKLRFPMISKKEMVAQLDEGKWSFLQYEYDGETTVSFNDLYDEKEIIAEYTDYNRNQYLKYFKKNRRKKKLLPIFSSESDLINMLHFPWLYVRDKIIRILVNTGIKGESH
ncbi:MAG: CapA family protein [Butyrivibrio sp.]|nr:CapA family protein [Butyrivibrio sp.]